MASTINASTSPAAIVQTADGTANLSLQSNGTTILALTSSGVAITGTLTATGTAFGPTVKYVTDATDITLVDITSSQVNVGTSFSVSIPTTGYINLTSFAGRLTYLSGGDTVACALGIRISSTNYWFGKWSRNATIYYAGIVGSANSAGYDEYWGSVLKYASTNINAYDQAPLGLDIIANSVPTGTQTVQLIAAYGAGTTLGIGILKGTTTTTRVALEFVSAS